MSGVWLASIGRRAVLIAFVCLATPGLVQAQTVVDAGIAEFVASADHHQVTGGQAVVTSYQLQIFAAGTTQTVRTVELGKPAPQTNGIIRINFVPLLAAPLPGGVEYQARVSATGPGGSSASGLSNRFSYSVPCAPSVSPTSGTMTAAGGPGTASVSAGSGCAWTAVSGASWLAITSGAGGSGNGTVGFAAQANPSTSPRTGTLTVAGQTVSITQAAAPCSYSVGTQAISSPAQGTSGVLGVTTTGGCSWTVTNLPSWLSVSRTSGTGSGTLTYTFAPNSTQPRTATILVAGRSVTVSQTAALAAPANLRVVSTKK